MIDLNYFVKDFPDALLKKKNATAWEITRDLKELLTDYILTLDTDFIINDNVAIHKTAVIENNVVLKGPIVIEENCFVAANVYLRDGVYLGKKVSVGPGCEIKRSVICEGSSLAHFNFIGDSIIGVNVNFEAGAVIANHYNERTDKKISIFFNGDRKTINAIKFGALVGDNSRIGANAVLSPGTVLLPDTIIKRLELVEQNPLS